MFESGDVTKQFLPKDGVLFEEGDPGDAAYIVESGSVGIFKSVDEGTLHLATLKDGELFGEMAIIDGSDRMASAMAIEDSVVVRIPSDVLEAKLGQYDTFLQALIKILVNNLRNVHRAYVRRPRSIHDFVNAIATQSQSLRGYLKVVEEADSEAELLQRLDALDAAARDVVRMFEGRPDRRRSVITDTDL
jgi:CRP-like cAMP-binding protein